MGSNCTWKSIILNFTNQRNVQSEDLNGTHLSMPKHECKFNIYKRKHKCGGFWQVHFMNYQNWELDLCYTSSFYDILRSTCIFEVLSRIFYSQHRIERYEYSLLLALLLFGFISSRDSIIKLYQIEFDWRVLHLAISLTVALLFESMHELFSVSLLTWPL